MKTRHISALCAGLLLAACGGDMSDLETYALEVKSRKSRAIEPIPQIKPYEPFTYEANDRRDPFAPLLQTRADVLAAAGEGALRPDLNRPKEPLEEFPLDGLRMLGTITMQNRAYALIKAPDAVVHRVSVGDHMGQNFGKVTGISESEVVLVEIIQDGFGGWMQRPASIALVQ